MGHPRDHPHERRARRIRDLVAWGAVVAVGLTLVAVGASDEPGVAAVIGGAGAAIALLALVLWITRTAVYDLDRARCSDTASRTSRPVRAGPFATAVGQPAAYGLVEGEDGTVAPAWHPVRRMAHALAALALLAALAAEALSDPTAGAVAPLGLLLIAVLWRSRRYAAPAVVLSPEGLRQPVTGASVRWADVTDISSRRYDGPIHGGVLHHLVVDGGPRGVRRRRWGRPRSRIRVFHGSLDVDASGLASALHDARRAAGRDAGQ